LAAGLGDITISVALTCSLKGSSSTTFMEPANSCCSRPYNQAQDQPDTIFADYLPTVEDLKRPINDPKRYSASQLYALAKKNQEKHKVK
jgi:hypothetical protein